MLASPPHICIKKKSSSKKVKFDPRILLLDVCQKGVSQEFTLASFQDLVSQVDYATILSPQKNMTLLHIACSYGQKDLVRILLQQPHVRVNQQDFEGWTPLHCAAAEGDLEMMQLLGKCSKVLVTGVFDIYVEDGPVNLAAETFDGESVEDLALEERASRVISLLRGNG